MPIQNGPVPPTPESATSKSSTSSDEVANAAKTKPEVANGPTKAQLKATLVKDDQKPVANGPMSINAATSSVTSSAGPTPSSAPLPAVSKPQSASSATTAKSIRVSFSDGGEVPHARAAESSPYPIVTEAIEATAGKKPEPKKPKRSNKSQRDAAKGSSAPSTAAGAESSSGPSAREPLPPLVNGFSHDAEPAVPVPVPSPVAAVSAPEAERAQEKEQEQ